jgi:hypothetical protein
MTTVKYYVARLNAKRWPDAAACLADHGIGVEHAQQVLKHAHLNQSGDLAFVPLTRDKGLVLRIAVHGHCEAWWAITDKELLFDTPEEAREFADEMESSMLKGGTPPGAWGIFQWTPPTKRAQRKPRQDPNLAKRKGELTKARKAVARVRAAITESAA